MKALLFSPEEYNKAFIGCHYYGISVTRMAGRLYNVSGWSVPAGQEKAEAEMAWYVYTLPAVGSLILILIVASVLLVLWRRRKSGAGKDGLSGGEAIPMKAKKSKVKYDYRPVSRSQSQPPPAEV